MSGAAGGVRVSQRAGVEVLGKSGKEQNELRVKSSPCWWEALGSVPNTAKRREKKRPEGPKPQLY